MAKENRLSGVLVPVASLPSRFGIGDFGEESRLFVDLLALGGYKLWQILPLNPLGYGHSPYQPFSSFAIDEQFADLDDLAAKGLIAKAPSFRSDSPRIAYEEIRSFKEPYLRAAFAAEIGHDPHCADAFASTHPWVRDWALFMLNKRRNEFRSWNEWPAEQRNMILTRRPLSPEEEKASLYEIWLQKTLYEEWALLKSYANLKGIRLIGDVPFYVGYDSCDVWGSQDMFLLDPITKEPQWVAGVPPDYFSKTGQRWGNPIYDWDSLASTGFRFLIDRLRRNGELYDVVRLDHFRAFDTYWKIPASCPTAIEGTWVEAPGYRFFDAFFQEERKLEIIAEDLGDLRPQVLTLRDHYHLPGMNVVEFTFHDAMIVRKPGLDRPNMVAYIGTHDNDPLKSFFAKLPLAEQNAWLKALNEAKIPAGDINERIIRYTLGLQAKYAIIALQDLLGLGSEARLNVPGIINDINWTWRLPDYASFQERLPHLAELNSLSKRS